MFGFAVKGFRVQGLGLCLGLLAPTPGAVESPSQKGCLGFVFRALGLRD